MVHRADYHAVLLQKAVDLGVTILKNSRVVEYDWNAPAVKVGSNDWITGDVIIAADGRHKLSFELNLIAEKLQAFKVKLEDRF